ncbi:SDR family NAD(P)-dependent oxidoreductase [Streptomyces sp. NPDC057620]|uniref:SDR family oxidoreductase n=1 Tax=Streptomyces liliiviolaceus TaxID=2823109 RepID=A0A940Y3Y5_9ACTN|nr:SDR family NAD(P)-dependent oxidoreductase [Streptomyces liliiviolaceus]MBQ0854870.1 SDR family oxidoreductase [Streptomyces liliiviolaceus]
MDTLRIDRRVVLVTGAASGIGHAIARACAAEGATVHLADVSDSVHEAAGKVTAAGSGSVTSHVCDVTDPDAVRTLVDDVTAASGRLDVAFLNAGINGVPSLLQPGGAIDELPFAAWRRVMDVNLDGLFHCLQHCARVMKEQRSGSIVVTASTAGLRAEPRVSYPYVASKAAVVGLVRQASLELARFGVRVNALAPGPVVTNIGGPGPRPEAAVAAWEDSIPMRRWGRPDDITGAALLLASDDSSWMTGGVHVVDGGASALTQIPSTVLPAPAPDAGSTAAGR